MNRFPAALVSVLLCAVAADADERLVKQLKKGNPMERAEAAWYLGKSKVVSAVPDLAAALKDKSPEVRANAAGALWSIGDEAASAQPALREALGDSNGRVRINAAGALWKMDVPQAELMPALDPVVAGEDDRDAAEAADLLISMGREPQPLVPALLRGLDDPDAEAREEVLENLKEQDASPAYLPVLLKGLKDGEEVVRAYSAGLLGNKVYATPEVVAALKKATSDRSSFVREQATGALAKVGTAVGGAAADTAAAALMKGLGDRDAGVRQDAAERLGRARKYSPEIATALRGLLKDKDRRVRGAAAEALGEIGAKEAIPELWQMWNNKKEDGFTRHAAGRGLGSLGEKVDWTKE